MGRLNGVIGLGSWPRPSHQDVLTCINNLPAQCCNDYNRVSFTPPLTLTLFFSVKYVNIHCVSLFQVAIPLILCKTCWKLGETKPHVGNTRNFKSNYLKFPWTLYYQKLQLKFVLTGDTRWFWCWDVTRGPGLCPWSKQRSCWCLNAGHWKGKQVECLPEKQLWQESCRGNYTFLKSPSLPPSPIPWSTFT